MSSIKIGMSKTAPGCWNSRYSRYPFGFRSIFGVSVVIGFDNFFDRFRIFCIKSTVIRDFRLSDSDTRFRHLPKQETVYTV